MTPGGLLRDLRARGVALRTEGGDLYASPRGVLTAEDRARVAALKPALVALLWAEAVTVDEVARLIDARVIHAAPPALRCACGAQEWRPGRPGWVNCVACDARVRGREEGAPKHG